MRPRKKQSEQTCLICGVTVASGWVYSIIPRLYLPFCDVHLCCPDCGSGHQWLDLHVGGEFKFKCRKCYYEGSYRAKVAKDIQRHHEENDENS